MLSIKLKNETEFLCLIRLRHIKAARGFFNRALPYKITVKDPKDGSTAKGDIPAENVFVNLGYLPQGKDLADLGQDAIISPHNEGRHDLFFVFKGGDKTERKLPALDWIYFHSDAEVRQ